MATKNFCYFSDVPLRQFHALLRKYGEKMAGAKGTLIADAARGER
jgi:hypothetical protein